MKRNTIVATAVLLLVSAVMALAVQLKRPDMPPGVPPGRWFALNDNSGVVLGPDHESAPSRDGTPALRGKLMVRHQGVWMRVYMDQPATESIIPIK